MGNILSRKLSTREQLQIYEKELETKEKRLMLLQKAPSLLKFILFTLALVVAAVTTAYYEGYSCWLMIIAALMCAVALRIAYNCVRAARIGALQKAVGALRKKQLQLVNEYKKDNNFAFAKQIVDRYDDEERRDSFFLQVQRKRKDAVEKIADYVLANDPSTMNALICSNCGLHNGLVDPANANLRFFYCYSCKAKNTRNVE
ncbi:hypothetical protein PAPHI01_1565 [Pancytospora philotis]|nr:hypothetical protein PAPHI01_1548 [Pancytospora philotis]KAI4292291.1 hypothetical protein PAPHI01_1565 [Pancytospora philotis]